MTTSSCASPGQLPDPPVSEEKHAGRRFRFLVRTLVRLLFLSGFAALAMATLHTARTGAPDWFQSPIYQSCEGVGVGLAIFWGISELLMACTHHAGRLLWVFVMAVAAIYIPWFYVFRAAWYGQAIADWQTWHLLPMFAIVNMALVTTFLGVVSAVVIAVSSVVLRFCAGRPKHMAPAH